MSLIATAALLLLAVLILRRLVSSLSEWHSSRSKGCSPPPTLPLWDPILGLDFTYNTWKSIVAGDRIKKITAALAQRNGTYQVAPALGVKCLYTMAPENAQAILATDFDSWEMVPQRAVSGMELWGEGIMVSSGHVWRKSRALIKQTFQRSQVTDREMFEFHVERFMKLLPRNGETVDLAPLFARLNVDAGSEFIFGQSFDSLVPGNSKAGDEFNKRFHDAQFGVLRRAVFGMTFSGFYGDEFSESCKIVRGYVDNFIDSAMGRSARREKSGGSNDKSKYYLVNDLVETTSDRGFMKDQLLQVFLGGHEGLAALMTNAMFLIARNPSVWTKLRLEVQGLSPGDLTFERLKSLKYLQWTIKEVLRLHSPAPATTRLCVKPTILPVGGGPDGQQPIAVQPGTGCLVAIEALHRNRAFYGEDADAFRPERWENLRATSFEYIPFLGGPRVCPGQQLTLFWGSNTLARMAMQFKAIENRDDVLEFVEEQTLAMNCRNGAKVALVPV